jgi:alkaline phosphatase
LDWLAADLARHRDRPTLVLVHENLDARDEQPEPDPHVARNARQARAILENAGQVLAVIQGHYHPGLVTDIHGIPCFSLTAMVTGPGLANNAYGVVTVEGDGAVSLQGFGRQIDLRGRAPGAEV